MEEKRWALHAMKDVLAHLVAKCSGQGEITDCSMVALLGTDERIARCTDG
jgi:hypothetical protein